MRLYYFNGANYALENAKGHLQIADAATNLSQFGIARSLYILSAEEAIKAAIIIARTFQDDLPIGYKKVFKSHQYKHYGLQFITNLIKKHIKQNKDLFDYSKFADKENLPEKVFMEIYLSIPRNKREYDWLKEQEKSPFPFEDALAWWRNAEDSRNKGFYVEEVAEKKWHIPKEYSISDLEKAKQYTSKIVEYVEKFISDCEWPDFFTEILQQKE